MEEILHININEFLSFLGFTVGVFFFLVILYRIVFDRHYRLESHVRWSEHQQEDVVDSPGHGGWHGVVLSVVSNHIVPACDVGFPVPGCMMGNFHSSPRQSYRDSRTSSLCTH